MAGAGGFQTDPESLKAEGTSFVKLGEDFQSSVKRLMDGLHALGAGPPGTPPKPGSTPKEPEKSFGEKFWSGLTTLDSKADSPPWGDDEIGEKFGVAYEGLRDGMYESMGHLSAKLQEIGKALTSMSKNYAEGEDFNDSLMKQHVDNKQAWSDPTAPKDDVKVTYTDYTRPH
ncbi:hypothetical protein [Streptomyces sp. MST-110588]|uniref:hypothetical protein n=1 Tax=Streptomyces sp. MST-110588 TaxID=2833628 RepID=UPI001F5D1308|nr:hypothetical protein [Streptomyces sp. MST-110588]UNO41912.1 hypothetical protein KGS77_23165 [Streptomyces sp. MST-110588]